jgi:hypothetical protein
VRSRFIAGFLLVMVLATVGGIFVERGLLRFSIKSNPSATPTPGRVSLKGQMVCLPHKNTSGLQTLECAFGLLGDDGKYYGLRDTDPQYKNVSGLPMNQEVVVNGQFIPKEDQVYQSIGIIEVDSVKTP